MPESWHTIEIKLQVCSAYGILASQELMAEGGNGVEITEYARLGIMKKVCMWIPLWGMPGLLKEYFSTQEEFEKNKREALENCRFEYGLLYTSSH